MFRNRWGALLFVVMTAAGAAALVGGEQDKGVLLNAAEDIQRQKIAMDATISDMSTSPDAIPTSSELEFSSDDELIDEAAGFDPNPPEADAAAADELVPHDEVVIVSRNERESGQ